MWGETVRLADASFLASFKGQPASGGGEGYNWIELNCHIDLLIELILLGRRSTIPFSHHKLVWLACCVGVGHESWT